MGRACLDLGELEPIARGASPDPECAEHLRTCSHCRAALSQVSANERFLSRIAAGLRGESETAQRTSAGDAPESVHLSDEIPGYQLESVVGAGGQGVVYRAIQLGTGRRVAIKVPHSSSLRRQSRRLRFEREIELTARLDHPAIVRVLGACEISDGRIGCVMEYIEAAPIDLWAERCRERGRGGVREIVEAIAVVADAVAHAHQRGVLHRDLKPSNVVVDADGQPRVLDFGLAKALGADSDSFETVTGAFLGTLAFTAPEQLSHGSEVVDVRSDVHALGLLLYQAISGRLPYDLEGGAAPLLRQVREGPLVSLAEAAPAADADLDAIVMCALRIDPSRRYPSASALRDDLRRWLDGAPVAVRSESRWYLLSRTVWRRRRAVAVALVAVAAAGTIGALAWNASRAGARADLATADRDAYARGSRWVALAQARATAREGNFDLGESAAWDLVLGAQEGSEPGLSDPIASGPTLPADPAFWALWEMYQRTPIAASLPGSFAPGACFGASDELLCTLGSEGFARWDWRSGRLVSCMALPAECAPRALAHCRIRDEQAAFLLNDGVEVLSFVSNEPHRIPAGPCAFAQAWAGRLATLRLESDRPRWCELWDTTVSPPVRIVQRHTDSYWLTAAVDPARSRMAALAVDGTVEVLDTASGALLGVVAPSAEFRRDFIYLDERDGSFLLVDANAIERIELDGGSAPSTALVDSRAGAGTIRRIVISADGSRFARWSARSEIWAGRCSGGGPLGSQLAGVRGGPPALSGSGRYIATVLVGSERLIVEDLDRVGIRSIAGPATTSQNGSATAFAVQFTAGDAEILVGSIDGSIRRVALADPSRPAEVEQVNGSGVAALACVKDGLIAGGHDFPGSGAELVHFHGGQRSGIGPSDSKRYSGLVTSADGRCWSLCADGVLRRYQAPGWMAVAEARLAEAPIAWDFRALARAPGLGVLVVGRGAGRLLLVDDGSLKPLAPPTVCPPVRDIDSSPADESVVATAHDDGSVRLWRITRGATPGLQPLGTVGTHSSACFAVAFHPAGQVLVSGAGDAESPDLRFWSVQDRRELASLDLFAGGVFDLRFSTDGRWLAACGEPDPAQPSSGGQAFLIDMTAPTQCMAGNLAYHEARRARQGLASAGGGATVRGWIGSAGGSPGVSTGAGRMRPDAAAAPSERGPAPF